MAGIIAVIGGGDIPTQREWIAIACLCALCAAGWLLLSARPPGLVAVVTAEGAETARLPLDRDSEYILPGNTISIENGAARVTHATCPDGLCVRHGGIRSQGEVIACLPNRVVITISGGVPSGVDAVSH